MQTCWLGPRSISTGSVSEQTGGPDLLPTNPGTQAAVPDGEASPDLSREDMLPGRVPRLCGTCGTLCGEGGGLLGSLAAGPGVQSIPSGLLRHCSAGVSASP